MLRIELYVSQLRLFLLNHRLLTKRLVLIHVQVEHVNLKIEVCTSVNQAPRS